MMSRKIVQRYVTIIIFGIVIFFFLNYLRGHWTDFKVMLDMPPKFLLAILGCTLCTILPDYWFIKVSMRHINVNLQVTEWIGIPACSNIIGIFMPFRSDLVFRGVYYKKKCGLSYSKFGGLTIGSTVVMLIIYYINMLICLFGLSYLSQEKSILYLALIFTGLLILGLVFLTLLVRYRKWFYRFSFIDRYMRSIIEGIADILSSRKVIFWCIFTIFISNVFGILRFYLSAKSLQLTCSMPIVILYYCVFQAMGLLAIIPGNVGITEFIIGLIAEITGGIFECGVMISLIARVTGIITYLMIALVFVYPVAKRVRRTETER